MSGRYEIVNVFTETPAGGNPLAVFPNARGIDDASMEQLAKDFVGFSEITFVLPPDNPAHTAKVRIWTPNGEFRFAGHPNVGTAYVLGNLDPNVETMIFEQLAGLIDVNLTRKNGKVTAASIKVPQPLTIGAELDADMVAACLSLPGKYFSVGSNSPVFASVGTPYVLAQVDPNFMDKLEPNLEAFLALINRYNPKDGRASIYAYAPSGNGEIQARLFDRHGHEDAATGSAAAALAAYLANQNLSASDGSRDIVIKQGIKMGRPSQIDITVHEKDRQIESVWISGPCVAVRQGEVVQRPLPDGKTLWSLDSKHL